MNVVAVHFPPPNQHSLPMQPARVGPYLIERKVGSGGMGTVYYGRHAETGQEAAVKVLPASLAREEGFIVRFAREIDALKKLSNPHIVKLFDSGVDGDTYYYAMEYVGAETLTNRLRDEKRIPWREVIDVAVQICAALKAAHDAGIIHRDLKPSNLLIAPDGQVKLMDFGVAQVFAGTKLTATGGIIGTAEYMSPEQAQGQRVTRRSDLYSLGAVMYAMLTGRPPFSGKTTIEVIHKHRYGRYDPPRLVVPEVPSWLDDIVCQLLEKDPEKRFPDAFVLSRRLEEVIRKVELSSAERTVAVDSADATSPTLVHEPAPGRGAGGGTLMRNLLRAELDQEMQPSTVGRLLDNTWVLVGLLVLVVVGGVLWFRSRNLDAEEMYEAGVALIKEPEGTGWLRARDEFFEPLLEQDAEAWSEKVEPHLRKIEMYELKTAFRPGGLRRRTEPADDAQRFLRLAQSYREAGDLARAESTLVALEVLLAGDESRGAIHLLVQQLLDDLRSQRRKEPAEGDLLAAAADRADRLVQEGEADQAEAIWQGIIELYGDDPAAREQVDRARAALAGNGR